MRFTPVLPFRGNGRPSVATPFVTRPSGDPVVGGPIGAGGAIGITITNMPPYGRVFVDDVELDLRGGRWDGGAFIVPITGTGSRIRVTNQSGSQVRGEEGLVDSASVFDWNTLPIIAGGTGTNTLRIENMTGGGRVYIDDVEVSPVGGRWDSSTWVMLNPPRGRRLRIVAVNGVVREQDFGSVVDIENANWLTMGVRAAASPTGLLAVEGLPAGWSVWVPVYRAPDSADASAQINGYLRLGQSAGGSDPTVVTAKAGPFTAPELKFRSPDGSRWIDYPDAFTVPVNNGVLVNASALFAGSSRPPLTFMGGFTLPDSIPTARASLTVVGPPGWQAAIAYQGSTTPLGAAVIPASGGITIPVEVRSYDMLVSDGARSPVLRTITVPPAGLTVDLRTFYPAAPAGGGPSPTPVRTGIRITGLPAGAVVSIDGRVVTGDASGFFPTPPAASVTVQIVAGGVTRRGTIGIPADREQTLLADGIPVVPESTSPPPPVDRGTQGPTVASATTGELYLTGAPPQSVVTVPGISYTVNDSGLPVLFDLAPGTYALTVRPPSGATRSASVTIAAGARSPVAYGAMPAPQSQMQAVGECGLIPNPPPGVPESVCEGSLYPSTNGTTYLAVMREGKVGLVPQGNVPQGNTAQPAAEGWSTGAKVAVVVALAAGGYYAWREWGSDDKAKGGKQENPSKGKCSRGGGH